QTGVLADYFSEYALIKYRVLVEIEYFFFLADKKFFTLPANIKKQLKKLTDEFSEEDAKAIKKIESVTNHDVKAVEYYIKEKLEAAGGGHLKEWIQDRKSTRLNSSHVKIS